MKLPHMQFTDKSALKVSEFCDKIRSHHRAKRKAKDMAESIAEYVETFNALSKKQAEWLCRTGDFLRLERPKELAGIDYNDTDKTDAKMMAALFENFENKMLVRLNRIERLIENRLPIKS